MDVERLLEKYNADIRHIETERHWFLGAYAVVAAGVLAFLAQNSIALNFIFGFGALWLLSLLGLIFSLRAGWVLGVLQSEIQDIVKDYSDLSQHQIYAAGSEKTVLNAYQACQKHGINPEYFYSDWIS